jgi:SAM-dependent methyltransferase
VSEFPVPPNELVARVGWDTHAAGDLRAAYLQRGLMHWQLVKSLTPEGITHAGRRVLDFGSGAGRIVRHALAEDPGAEFWACDIDAPSIAWLDDHLSPPLHVARISEWPPTPFRDDQFDLVYCFSVFTHLLDSWSAWLLELHRILAPTGVAIVTVFGPGAAAHRDLPLDEQHVGMLAFEPGTPWDDGGPLIAHSEWWLRAHWGRAFEIRSIQRGDASGAPPLFGQAALVLRKRPGTFTAGELEQPAPGEPRELAAANTQAASLRREVERLTAELEVFATSRSWRLTAPLRGLARALRRGRERRSRGRSV